MLSRVGFRFVYHGSGHPRQRRVCHLKEGIFTKTEKTNALRLLDRSKIEYETREYDPDATVGEDVASLIGNPPERTFKTLVTVSDKGRYYVFVVPVVGSLDLKKAAKQVGAKSVAMIKQKDLLPLTGYVHGGCSPFGMKKVFPTFVHESAKEYEKIAFSAGRRGLQAIAPPDCIINVLGAEYADILTT